MNDSESGNALRYGNVLHDHMRSQGVALYSGTLWLVLCDRRSTVASSDALRKLRCYYRRRLQTYS